MIQMKNHTMQPLAVDTDSLALDTIHEVGPGGQYFDSAHTMARACSGASALHSGAAHVPWQFHT